jgi:hypothetical protein
MHTITISLSDDDFDALQRYCAPVVAMTVADVCEIAAGQKAREIRAREAVEMGDEPWPWH